MAKEIRQYQKDAVENFKKWYADKSPIERSGAFLMATGSGKTFTAALVAKELTAQGKKVLWLTNKRTLVEQSFNKIREELPDVKVGLEWGDYHAIKLDDVVVASVPSLRQDRLEKMLEKFKPDLIINDEAHHIKGNLWKSVLGHARLENVKCLNLTATPYTTRLKKIDLGTTLAHVTTEEGIKEGFLTPIITPQKLGINLEGVSIDSNTGDYKVDELSRVMTQDEVIDASVHACMQYKDRKNLVFCTSKEHAAKTALAMREQGLNVREMYGETDLETRFEYQEELRKGEINAIVSVSTISEGFDLPEADMITILRPTRSPGFYTQMLGRGLRRAAGKENCVLIDLYDKPKTLIDKDLKYIPTEEDVIRKRGMCMDPSIGVVKTFFAGFKNESTGQCLESYDDVIEVLGLHMKDVKVASYKRKREKDRTFSTFYATNKASRKVLEAYVREVLSMDSVTELVKTLHAYGYTYTPNPYIPPKQEVNSEKRDPEERSDIISGKIKHLSLDAERKLVANKLVTHEIAGLITNWLGGNTADYAFVPGKHGGGVTVFVRPKETKSLFRAKLIKGKLHSLEGLSEDEFANSVPGYTVSDSMRRKKASVAQMNFLSQLTHIPVKDIKKEKWSKAEAMVRINESLYKDEFACMEYWSQLYLTAPTKQAQDTVVINGSKELRKQKFQIYDLVKNVISKDNPSMNDILVNELAVKYCKTNIKDLMPLSKKEDIEKFIQKNPAVQERNNSIER